MGKLSRFGSLLRRKFWIMYVGWMCVFCNSCCGLFWEVCMSELIVYGSYGGCVYYYYYLLFGGGLFSCDE